MLAKFSGKPIKILFLTLGLVLIIVLTAVLVSNLLVYTGQQQLAAELFGNYKVEKIIYAHPLIEFAEDSFKLQSVSLDAQIMTFFYGDKPEEKFSITYEKNDLSVDDFNSSFNIEASRPDVSFYKEREQWILSRTSNWQSAYRLYRLDGELWLAFLSLNPRVENSDEFVCEIYKLSR